MPAGRVGGFSSGDKCWDPRSGVSSLTPIHTSVVYFLFLLERVLTDAGLNPESEGRKG